ncbi:PspC domain-containing protein [Plantactinospora siamensis]|uniref:PspC domain-containing protein n=1 Tax=Plantactinospora siamensis TaxID=555372 RepID=A0ABV6NRY6_9ACTN
MNTVYESFHRQGLVRPRDGRVLGGVCAGLGRRFGLDPWPARLLFVLVLLLIPGSQILIYPVLWILMPAETTVAGPAALSTPAGPATPTGWTTPPAPTA